MFELGETFAVPPLLAQVAVAIAIGALIGLERERRERRKFAGLRTMALLCGMGPVAVFVAIESGHDAVLPVLLGLYLGLAVALALGIAYVRFALHNDAFGFTTSVTVVVVAFLGLLVGFELYVEATSIAIITTVVLAERDRLHSYVAGLTDREVRDSLKLGALVFVLYPILPSEAIDPYGVVVLREVLLFAIFVLLIQFSAYVLMRTVGGSKGLAVTGLLAGTANSFAAAGVLTDIASRSRAARDAASFALLLTVSSMMLRNLAIAAVLAVAMVGVLLQPALLLVGLALSAAGIIWYVGEQDESLEIDVDSPFSFVSAAKFAGAYVVILVVAVVTEAAVGDVGLYGAALVGGLVSSAAVAVTAATVLNEGTVAVEVAVGMVILGIVASLLAKIVLIEVTKSGMRMQAGVPMAAIAVAGVGAFGVISMELPMIPVLIGGVVVVVAGVTVTAVVSAVTDIDRARRKA